MGIPMLVRRSPRDGQKDPGNTCPSPWEGSLTGWGGGPRLGSAAACQFTAIDGSGVSAPGSFFCPQGRVGYIGMLQKDAAWAAGSTTDSGKPLFVNHMRQIRAQKKVVDAPVDKSSTGFNFLSVGIVRNCRIRWDEFPFGRSCRKSI